LHFCGFEFLEVEIVAAEAAGDVARMPYEHDEPIGTERIAVTADEHGFFTEANEVNEGSFQSLFPPFPSVEMGRRGTPPSDF
jgi:hypothetical protein